MQAALYRRFNEVIDGYRLDKKPKRDVWVRRLFDALDWRDRTTFSTVRNNDGFSLEVDNCRVIDVMVDTPKNVEKVYSALNRAYNKDVSWVVATDFENLAVFGSYWVSFSHDVSSALAFSINFDDYLAEAQKFDLLTPHEVARNRLDAYYSLYEYRKKRTPIDIHLVERMGEWRRLALEALNNPSSSDDPSVHRLINALFLVRYLEDAKLSTSSLEQLISHGDPAKTSKDLSHLFKEVQVRTGYKGPTVNELHRLDPAPLRSLVFQLYGYPELGIRYDFAAMSVDILGRFYEEYLKLRVDTRGAEPSGTQTLSLFKDSSTRTLHDIRKQRGIYYTPRFVVDYITGNLLDRFTSSADGIPSISDLSCGSGTFLAAAIDQLERRKLLTEEAVSKIYGFDIDSRAIEATRLNLTAKLLGKTLSVPLPDLNLIEFDLLREGLDSNTTPTVLQGRMEIVVGNPPYIHFEKLTSTYPAVKLALRFVTAVKRVDSYILFVEAAVRALKPGGLAGLVIPNAFLRSQAAGPLREYLSKNVDILEVVDFLDQPVFQGVSTYICLLLFRKKDANVSAPLVTVARVYRLSETPSAQLAKLSVNLDVDSQGHEVFHSPQPTGSGPWIFRNSLEEKILDTIGKGKVRLDSAVSIRQGVKTGADGVFVIEDDELSAAQIETDITIPVLRNRELRRWSSHPKARLIYPYDKETGKLYPWNIIEKQFPHTALYLQTNRDVLEKRKSLRGKKWYELIEPRTQTVLTQEPRLFLSELSLRPSISITAEKYTAVVGSTGGGSWLVLENKEYDLFSILAFLNSTAAEWFFRQVSSRRKGGWLLFEQHLIKSLPLPFFLSDKGSYARHRIGEIAKALVRRVSTIKGVLSAETRREILATEEQIDSLVIEALGLSAIEGDYLRSRTVGLRKPATTSSELTLF